MRIAAVFLLIATPAFAQQPPPVAIEFTADEVKQVEDYLGGQPFKVVAPIMNFLAQKQAQARDAAARKAAEAKGKPE